MAGRHGKYLYRQAGSPNWYLRLVTPPGQDGFGRTREEISFKTADRDEALAIAAPLIRAHKLMLISARSMKVGKTTRRYAYEPNREQVFPDGSRIVPTVKDVIHIDALGSVSKVEPNRVREMVEWQATAHEAKAAGITVKKARGPDPDLQILEDYLALKERNRFYNDESRRTWTEFKDFVGGKALSKCTRSDGRDFAKHLREEKKLKTATIIKLINYLAAPINHANETGDMKGNPFFEVVTHVDDAKEVIDFSESDMRLLRETMLPKLDKDERLMWLILATTGMRHSEVFSIREEFEEEGVRYVKVGKKTESSKRKVPLPNCLIPHLPARINGPLFDDPSLKNISKNLLRALRRAGIDDSRKVVYSTRHRAHTRLRNVGCDGDIQREIVGHESGEDHVNYGRFPIRVLQRWINEIGY
jgi:integrase